MISSARNPVDEPPAPTTSSTVLIVPNVEITFRSYVSGTISRD